MKLNNQNFNIRLRRGTAANLALSTTYLQEGELAYTTDTKQLNIGDASNNKLRVVTADSSGDVDLGIHNLTVGSGTLITGTPVLVDPILTVNVNNGGTGYTGGDILTLTAGDGTATVRADVYTGTIHDDYLVSGGTGYTDGDTLTFNGGTAQVIVSVTGGVINPDPLTLVDGGTGYVDGIVGVTGGTGNNDATFNISVDGISGVISGVTLVNSGTNYSVGTSSVTGGTGNNDAIINIDSILNGAIRIGTTAVPPNVDSRNGIWFANVDPLPGMSIQTGNSLLEFTNNIDDDGVGPLPNVVDLTNPGVKFSLDARGAYGKFHIYTRNVGSASLLQPFSIGEDNLIRLGNSTGVYGVNAILDTNSITTSDKTFTFPNTTGTIQVNNVSPLLDQALIPLDASLGNTFTLVATGDREIDIPTNPTDGQKIMIRHTASGADRTLSLNTGAGGFAFTSTVASIPLTPSGKTQLIDAIFNSTSGYWEVWAEGQTL